MDSLYPHAQNDNPSTKICSKCKRELPATPEFFARNRTNKDGLQYYCKQCRSIAAPKYIPPEGYQQCSKCKEVYPATTEYFGPEKARNGRKARLSSHCRQCKRASDRGYAAANKEKIKAYKDKYNSEHKDLRKAYDIEHKEQIERNRKAWTERNRERISDLHKTYCQQYYKTERGRLQMRTSSSRRRARKRNAPGSYTTEELYQQLRRQKNKCYYCHQKLGKDRSSWHADHIVPLTRENTSNEIHNIVIACPTCNIKKKDKLPHEWPEGGRLL